jgi:hypothetical protein
MTTTKGIGFALIGNDRYALMTHSERRVQRNGEDIGVPVDLYGLNTVEERKAAIDAARDKAALLARDAARERRVKYLGLIR